MNLLTRLAKLIDDNLVTDAGRPLSIAFPEQRPTSPDEIISGHLHAAWPCCPVCCPAASPCPVIHRAACDCQAAS